MSWSGYNIIIISVPSPGSVIVNLVSFYILFCFRKRNCCLQQALFLYYLYTSNFNWLPSSASFSNFQLRIISQFCSSIFRKFLFVFGKLRLNFILYIIFWVIQVLTNSLHCNIQSFVVNALFQKSYFSSSKQLTFLEIVQATSPAIRNA